MKKEFLAQLGLSEEQAQAVLVQYGKDVTSIKASNEQLQTQVDELQAQVGDRDKQLKKLEKAAGDNAELQKEIADLREKNEKQANEWQTKISEQSKNFSISNALRDAGAKNVKAVTALLDMDKVSVDDNGNLLGLSDQVKALQETDAYLFAQKQEEQQTKPKVELFAGGNPNSATPKDPSNMSLDEQTALYRKDPAQWQSMFGQK